MTSDKSLRFHPAADIFPMMENPDFQNMVADIREHGLIDPIMLHTDGSILDGRNRYRACIEAGVEPVFTTWSGTAGSETAFVISRNIHRRHLTREQKREMIAALLKETPERSNRQIAKDVKTDHKTVGAERSHLEQRGEIPHVANRTDTMGRSQPATRRPVNEVVGGGGAPEDGGVEQRVRRGLQMENDGENIKSVASALGMSADTYRKARYIVFLADRDDLSITETKLSIEALLAINQGLAITTQHKKVLAIIERIWGDARARRGTDPAHVERRRKERFDRVMGMLTHICSMTQDFEVPSLDQEQVSAIIKELKTAERNVRSLRVSIEEMYKEFETESAGSSTPDRRD